MTKYIVRYGAMRLLGFFTWPQQMTLYHGTRVVIHTTRGQEVGVVLCEATEKSTAGLSKDLEDDRILRIMTATDENEYRQMQASARDEFNRCQKIIRDMKIVMDLVRVERIFGGERVIVYYVAEGRIDFRELVKVLAAEFQTRIEMKQIGVRDETKLLADIGDCGREVCCNSWLVAMPPVSMKMAKLQKATLDPTKISGRCGRLKCCLRYEYDSYHEISQILPAIGRLVTTPDGQGRVIAQELLAKKVQVELMDHSRKIYEVQDIKAVPYDKRYKNRDRFNGDDSENDEAESDLDYIPDNPDNIDGCQTEDPSKILKNPTDLLNREEKSENESADLQEDTDRRSTNEKRYSDRHDFNKDRSFNRDRRDSRNENRRGNRNEPRRYDRNESKREAFSSNGSDRDEDKNSFSKNNDRSVKQTDFPGTSSRMVKPVNNQSEKEFNNTPFRESRREENTGHKNSNQTGSATEQQIQISIQTETKIIGENNDLLIQKEVVKEEIIKEMSIEKKTDAPKNNFDN